MAVFFKTQSFRRDIEKQLTEAVIKEITLRTPYKVVGNHEEADSLLTGTITYADKNLVVEAPTNLPRELNATINVAVNWTHNPPTEIEEQRLPTIVTETINFVPEVGETSLSALQPRHPEHGQADRGYDGAAVVQRRRIFNESADVRRRPVSRATGGRGAELAARRDASTVSRQADGTLGSRGRTILRDDDPIPKVMGIVNLTPDSFSDGGAGRLDRGGSVHAPTAGRRRGRPARSRRRIEPPGGRAGCARRRAAPGDPGRRGAGDRARPCRSRSTRPRPRSPARPSTPGPRSSTTSPPWAPIRRWCDVVARRGRRRRPHAHARHPRTMQVDPRYDDVVERGLRLPGAPRRVGRGAAAFPASGSPSTRESASARPSQHNLEILRNLDRFDNLGCAILIGTSRKGFLGTITGRPVG